MMAPSYIAARVFPWSPGFRAPRVGLGDAEEVKYTNLATSTASTGVSGAAALGLLGPLAATGIGLALVGVGVALDLLFTPSLYHQQESAATKVVDQAATVLLDNMNMYLRQPVRTRAMQAAALSNFDTTWSRVVQLCSNPQLGTPGQRCISERQRGGVAPWCPNPGHTGCDWFILYRDPIANDAGVTSDSAAASSPAAAASGPASTPASSPNQAGGDGTASAPGSKALLWIGLGFLAFALGYAVTE